MMQNLIPKDTWQDRIPKTNPCGITVITQHSKQVFAKCPKCGRIRNLRVCGCKDIMCENCLVEHQINCLRKEEI
jgi:hypothetical protein